VFYGSFRDKRDLLMRAAREMTAPLVGRAEEFVDRPAEPDEVLETLARKTLGFALRFTREHVRLCFKVAHTRRRQPDLAASA
jgi:AcrR family transcriptional regulator